MGLLSNEELFGQQPDQVLEESHPDAIPINFNEQNKYGSLDIVPELGKGVARGFLNIGAGIVGTADWIATTAFSPVYETLSDEYKVKVDKFNEFIFDERKRKIVLARKDLAADPENALAWVGAAVGEAIPYLMASIAGGFAAGMAAGAAGVGAGGVTAASMAGAASMGFTVEGEMAYQNAIDSGASESQANTERMLVGSINAAIEMLQVSSIMKLGKTVKTVGSLNALKQAVKKKALGQVLKQGGVLTSDLVWTALGEGIEEGTQEITSLLVPAILRDDVKRKDNGEVDWKTYFNQVGSATLGGAVVGGVFGGAKLISSLPKTPMTGMNEFSLEGLSEVVKANRKFPTLTKKEKTFADKLAKLNDIPRKQARKITASTLSRRFDTPLNRTEKASVVALQLGEENLTSLKKHKSLFKRTKVSDDAVTDTLNWAYNNGGVPVNPDMRSDFMSTIKTAANTRTAQINKGLRLRASGKEINQLNPYQAIRYALGDISVASGHNLNASWGTLNTKANTGKSFAVDRMKQVYKNVGIQPIDLHLSYAENNAIASYLFEDNDSALSGLSKTTKELAVELNKVLSKEGKQLVSSIRWNMWNKYGQAPKSIKKSKQAEILKAGQKAEQEGKLTEWLDQATWAAKENYYMTDSEDQTNSFVENLITPTDTLTQRKARAPGKSTKAAHTRRSRKAQWKSGSVIDNIHNHLSRLSITNAVMDDLDTFWNEFQDANPSRQDSELMKKFINNMTGKKVDIEPMAKVLKNTTSFFWRFHFLNPAKSAYFFTRNILQNMYMGNQMELNTITKAGKTLLSEKISGNYDQERVNTFKNTWENSISQKQQMWEQALLLESESSLGGRKSQLYHKAKYYADKWGSWAIKSDSANRTIAWNMYYTGANTVMAEYNKGETTWKHVQNSLKLNTLHFSQRLELQQLTEKPSEFNKKYAEYKTENTHFRYETALRSGAEQSVLSRALMGLAVYPRGVANLALTNGFTPLLQGLNTGDYRQAYIGLKSVLALALGMSLARKALKEVTGRDSYSLMPEWQPLGPGVTVVTDNIDRIWNIKYRMGQGELTSAQAVDQIISIAADNAEIVVPLFDIWADMYEVNNDASGVRFSKLVKSALKDEYPSYNYTERSFWEKISHVLWGGGFEIGENND